MPNKITYTITTADGKEHQVSKENVDKYGLQSYADAYKGATIRMRDAQKGDYDIPLQHFDNARKQGLHAFSLEHTSVQKQTAPKATPTPTTKPTPSPSVHPRQSTPQGSKPLLSDSFGKGTDFLKPKPVGYNLSEEHRTEVLGEQAKHSTNPTNPHVQRAVQLGNEAKAKRVEREQNRFGKPTIVKAFDDAVHGDKKAAKELGMQQAMQQKKDEIDYMQATGKELRNPVDAGLTYDENGDVVHSMFAPTVARDEHGNIVTNDSGEPLVGISSDEARAKAYGDSVQTGIEAQREKDKVDNLYKDAVGSVNDAFDEDYKKKEAFRKEHPFLGAVSDALEGFSNRGNALQYTPEGAKPGLAALGMLSKAAIAKNNADRYGDAGTLSRLYGGIMAGLTDASTYDFGITDTFNAANLYRAAKNYEEGKSTAKDKMLLDAAAIANNVQSEASDKLGGAFGAGQNLVGTIGFMAQMATNPASGVGKEAAASVAKTVAKRALQKFGKGAIAKAVTGLAKGAARVGMDAVEAGVVTGMYSPTKIVGDYLNRKTGDVQSDGKGGYIFQNKEYSDVKALAKAINGQYAENISEMWGEYLPGVGKVNAAIGRGARKIGLGKVVDAFEHMSSSNWAKTWKNFQERTKWNGMAGEYFEEVANNLYNAVTNGDMTLDTDPHTGVFNPKINLDTFYSVALMSGIMSGVNTAGYARERYKAPHEQRKADAQARSVFGERWDEYKNAIDNADEKQIGSVMEKIGSDKSLSNSQKIAALQYQYRTAVVHGVNAQDTKNKLEGQFNAMDEAYSMGYNLQDEKELNNTAILYDEAKKQATKATGWNEDTLESMIGEDGGASTLAYMKHSDEFNDGQLQAFTDYANARAAYNGMIQRVKDDIDTKVHESNLEVEQRTNLNTGAIHPATMKVDDRQVYVVNGNVVMLPDGSGVDHEHSDDFVVLRDAKTGKLEQADPSAISKVDAPINSEEEKEAAADNIRQTVAQQQADKIDGKLEFKQGDTYSIIDKEDGTQHSLSIIGDAIDEKTGQVNPEMVLVDIDGAQQPILLPKEQVQQQVDEARRVAVAATQVVEYAPTNSANNTYNINDDVTLSDENGNTVRGSITAPENEDGKFEVYTEQPINGKKVNLFSAEELDAITKAPETVAENATVQQPQQQEETEESVEKEAPKQQPTALERIPKDESGQPLYEQTDPETAWDAIVEQTEGDTNMAQTVADDMVSDLETGVKKAEKTKTKSGGSIAEKIAAEKERAAVIEQAKATLAHWRKIAAVNRMREAAIQAEEQRKADEVARVRKEQEEKERVEQEESERIKREALNGVPDFVEDKATDARARGYRRVNGDKIDRQEPINATKGKEVQVKFDDDNIPTGHVAIIEANQLQPSHKNGQRNPQHFIDEAQPKERKDDASVGAARKIAANIRPEEITSSITAYTGAPTVNSRGEVIQGNNRSAALREMWDNHQEQGDKYKQYLIDHAESFGLKPEDIAAMDKPVLVNMLDVNDDEAISLGQFVASDTESGGTERIKPKNVVKKLGDKMKNFANILLRAIDENISFAELVDSNGVNALKWLNANGVISPTQYKSAFDSRGNITAEAKNDIKGIMYQSIFEGGNTQLEEMFNALPAKAQKAILATAYRDYDSPQSERMIEDIQDSIMAYYALSHDSMFMNAKNHKDARIAVEAWRRQLAFDDVTGESYLPAEKYSNFALLLATMYKGDNQSLIQGTFNRLYDLIQGTQEETLFEQPDNTPRSLVQAIKETLNIEHNGQQGSNVLAGDSSASQEGRTGSNGDATPRGRSENINGAEANQGGTEGDSGRSGEEKEGLTKRTLLWEKGAKDTSTTGVAPANVSTEQASQSNEPAGSASNHNNDFEGKDKQSSDTKQEIVENYLEKPTRDADLFAMAERVAEEDKDKRTRKKEEAKVDTNPTEAQKEAGNYKKGHIKVDGFNVTIEQPKGSVRRGKDANGKEWETEMHNTYGYIRGTESVDGDHIDIFLSDNPTEGNVFVVDQVNKDGSFDEHKVMYGFSDMESARKAYLSNYEEGWQGLGNITEVSKEEFKKWIDSSKRKTKPFAEYSTVKTQGDVQTKKPTETEDFARQDLKELEDFQKNTDTTGRTTIDVDRYEAEDLFAPLLLDGKTSRLGVLTVVPDKITDPSGQIAVYDYSDEIDEKTNSGWQKWGDLTDEYNKTVDSSDKAQERGDTATLGFTSVDAALKFYDWLNTGGPKSANKVLEQSNEPMNADGHEYQENGSLQYSTEDLTNNTTAKRLATDTILSALNKAGIEVVRATDEQVQELLANTHATSLRTPQGTIYGWAVDGKIYLTEAGINPDTPIHEYTHLWAEAMMSKNKQGWNNIKTLLKGTSVWEEVVSDSNYSNITNNEDAVASEVLSRISGRENAARMESEAQKVIDEDKDVFEKAKSVTLLNRIKRALDMFWKWVGKELFKIKKFGSINEVTDRVLYDLMHSTKLNSNDKSLIGVHNISEQKLRKVLKQGGFANPSIAVIDTDKQVHNDYGEISLILPSRKINKSTGKNAGTFEGDAWTPMYPVVEKQISSDGRITIHNDINAVPKDMQSEVRNTLNRWLENGSDTDLSYLYLFQQGKAPQMIVEKPKYSNEVHKTLNDIMFGVNSVYNLSKNEIKKLVELYIQTELDGNIKEYNEAIQRKISKYEELIKRGKPNSLRYRVADSYLEDIEKYGYPLSPLINFVNDVQRDKIKQGSKNAQKTLNTASQIIKDAGLEKDFKNWIEGLNNRYQTKEVIFDGFTPTGKRRYIPNTLENVSKIMKKQGRQASAGISISFSNFAAAVMKANGSLDNIRKKKSKLTNEHKDIEDFEEKWKEVYFDLAMKLQPNANMFDDYGFARLQEAANEKNPQTYIRNVYGITLSEEDVQKLQDLVEAIREERPALYFETKFERPVILNEFSKAVVPEDLSDDLKKTLRDNGVEVFTYKRGDIEERQKATQEAAYSSNDIAFQVIDNSRDSELIAINEQFNRELAELTEENAQSKRLKLGYPSPMLSAAGVPDKPIILYGNKLLKKAKLHNFDVKELHNLPLAMQNPIAVFEGSHPNSFATLLEIKLGGHNTLASIEVNKKGEADFNFISSLFGKESKGVTKWILDGKLLSVDKEKAQSYISASALNADATYKNELSSAAKIVKDFVNPVIQDENLLRDDTDTLSDIEYEDGNFSELTAEEPLFNVSSSVRSFIEGNLFSEVDFSDSPNKNVNQAISKLTDDELLKEIAKGDSKEWNFYMEEYDRRHNKEFQEAVERYMNSLEDEKTSLDTAYGSYVNVAKNWSNGGYHTTERTLLRAQLDAIEDYVSKKESEQLSSVESEAYHQAKETVRKVGYDLTRLRLRPLEEGEVCHVERRYTESNGFSFTGKEHIESIEDIAYIFKQLETSSVENSFLVLIKDGTPTVLHLSIGSYATALAPIEQAIVAADAINPDKVLFVHNHPSGNISASKQDMDVQKKMKEIFGAKVMPAIIINTTSGKFGMFSEDGRLEDGNIPLPDEHNNIPINVYQFSQQVFAKDWNPEFAFRAVSPESIAEYVSSHRLGEHKKMSLIILDQAGHVTGNVFLPWTKLTDVDSHKNIMQIISYVNQMGGRSAILYGNYELAEDTRDTNKSIFKIKTAFSNSALHLMDVINIDDSALDRGAMEEDVEYGKRNLDEEKYREGYGSYTNSELSFINDPVAKMLGKSNRSEEDNKAFAERERRRMISRISELADKLHLNNIETVTDSNSLQGKKAKAKGFYSKSSGKITIVIPNHASVEDVEKTLLHEAVAHYGLRKLFGEHFETFLDNVYQNVEPEIRRIITSQAANNNWDFRTATEEYLAGLAERTDFERVHYAIWNKIKSLFLKMLHSIGFEGWSVTELSDNELRYLLWRSYENMKEPGIYRSILGEAEDVAKQNELKVGNYDQQDTNSSNVAERGILYREDDSKEKERVNAREKYEQRVNRTMFQTQEALQDSMLGLKEAMNAITKAEGNNVNIEDIDGYENAYLGENRLSSVNKAEADAFAHLLFKPMLAEVAKLCKNAQERNELVDYMMAKHGLERNAVMRKRAIEDILNNEKLSDAQKSARAGLAEYRDYAGLTALTGKDNVTEAEVDAETMVSEYENTHDTTNLWDKVNAVNAAILSKSYECGMMDKDTYEKISDMYEYYIPLRGFDETTSEEAYAYLLHQNSAFNAPIKVAKGRFSKADDPFANMQSMAESAITQGNRNKLVKQRFFNFVLNHPSDLVSISDIWLKYDDVADEWKPVFPDNFEENDSAEDIEQKLKEFEDKMKTLAEQAPDKYKHGKETANIPYRVVDSRDLRQHQVLVKRGGRDYILTLNGNPRAAQALNGQTNPDNDTSGAIGAILKAGEMVNRQLSAFYTTRNPDFVVSNFIRDMLFSNSIVWVKESPNYALRFHRNIARCNPAQIKVLLAKHRKGTLDMNNKLEHMFYQFMMNGGETGYANVRDIEQHKNDIRRELKRANGKLSITKAFNLLGEKLDEYNRAVENCARFAAYLTSREMGRTVERSIYDAKEISVNFNKKGSGAKFMNAVGQTKIGTASAFVSGIGRSGFVFWNAAIQGTTNFGRQFKKHPAKAFTASAIMFLLGAVIAGIGMGDGDDDADANSYWNLPEYVRRSNILFKIGDQWVSIPLPVEYRAIYGMGELMVSAMNGKEHFTGSELGKAIAGQATQVLPIDFLEGGGGVKAFVPSAVKPFAEVYSNKGWTGMPIYKDTPYNKYMPEWTKAYKSANKYLVGIAKTLNEATGGDAYTKGSVDINPAQIEYLLNGYFGGVSGTIDKLSKSAETIAGDREYDPRNFLLLNRILKNGDERTEARAINNEYMRVKEEHDVLKARMKHYENDTDKGLFDYADKIDFLYNSPEFARYEIFEDYSKDIDALYQELKEANDGAEHLLIEKELTELKKEMIEEMNKTRK
nr:LPD38 domain-containing protein [uncultured Prevotella sp.]